MVRMTAEDKKWRAESDARTLMEAVEIQSKKTRYNAALREVNNIKKDAEKTAKKAGKLAKNKPKKKTTRKTTKRRKK